MLVKDNLTTCPKCGSHEIGGVEYAYHHPERYDGISEWYCLKCTYREGRWSGKELAEGEAEKRYGGEK